MLKPHQEPTLMGRTVRPQQPIAAVKRFRSEIISGLHCRPECIVTPSGGQFFNFEAQYRQCSEVRGNPRHTTAIKRSKRQGMVPNDHSGRYVTYLKARQTSPVPPPPDAQKRHPARLRGKDFLLTQLPVSSEAFRHAARPIESDSPACSTDR